MVASVIYALFMLAFAGFEYWNGSYFGATFFASAAFSIFVIGYVELNIERVEQRIEKKVDRVWEELERLKERL